MVRRKGFMRPGGLILILSLAGLLFAGPLTPYGGASGQGAAWATEQEEAAGSAYYGTITGRVTVADAAESDAVAGALVVAWRSEDSVLYPLGTAAGERRAPADAWVAWARTDADGYFALRELPPGEYRLAAAAGEDASAWFKAALSSVVTVRAGQESTVELSLGGPYGALGGKVVDRGGVGVAQATVLAFPYVDAGKTATLEGGGEISAEADGGLALQQGRLRVRLEVRGEGRAVLNQEEAGLVARLAPYRGWTDQDGHFFLPAMPAGNYWVLVLKGGAYTYQKAEVKTRELTWLSLQLPFPRITPAPQPPGPEPRPGGSDGERGKIKVFLRGRLLEPDITPILEEGCVLVPLRALAEALGADVAYQGKGQVKIRKGQAEVKLQVRSKVAYKNGQSIALNAPVRLVGNHTMVPLRFLSEALGARVDWDAAARTVLVD